MTTIFREDLIASIADALQFISYYHPLDYIQALGEAYQREQSPAARDAIAQILTNSRMSAQGHRPICQDTGIVTDFIKVGMAVRWDDATMGVGDKVEVTLAAKGGGSENKSAFAALNPSDSVVDWVLETLPEMGAGWCPPGILGIGIGGTAEKAMLLAKEALMEPVDIQELQARGAKNRIEELRLELFEKINALGIGAQGLGGLTTVVDVKIMDYPTHAASLPVAMIPNCAATRHIHFTLDGNGPAVLVPPSLDDWPKIELKASADP